MWRIPPYSDTDDTPVLEIGDRIEGKNEGSVTANRLGNYNVGISGIGLPREAKWKSANVSCLVRDGS